MLYYRVAFRVEKDPRMDTSLLLENGGEESRGPVVHVFQFWKWRSTLLTSPQALFTLLRAYSFIPRDHIRVFFASSEDEMDEMLRRQNRGLLTSSLPADQFLAGKSMDTHDVRRLEFELSTLPAHDEPYHFALPQTLSEQMAWTRLLRRAREVDAIDL